MYVFCRSCDRSVYLDARGCHIDSIYWNWHNCTACHNTSSRFSISTTTENVAYFVTLQDKIN